MQRQSSALLKATRIRNLELSQRLVTGGIYRLKYLDNILSDLSDLGSMTHAEYESMKRDLDTLAKSFGQKRMDFENEWWRISRSD